MTPLVVIIPSRNMDNLRVSVPAVRTLEPDARVIIVDDGAVWRDVPQEFNGVEVIGGDSPFIFARNVNLGIRAAGDSDVILLNDDAVLETPGGFSIMQAAAEGDPQVGIVGAVTDLTGQPLQRRARNVAIEETARRMPAYGLRAVEHIAFVCVLLPLRTRTELSQRSLRTWVEPTELNGNPMVGCFGGKPDCPEYSHEHFVGGSHLFTGGLLDERYTAYGSDDLDYCMQVERAGLCVCVHDACFVAHGNHDTLRSSFRGLPTAAGDIWPNHRLLRKKWSMPPNPLDPEVRK